MQPCRPKIRNDEDGDRARSQKFQKQTKQFKAAQSVDMPKQVCNRRYSIVTAAETQRQADIDELAMICGSIELSNVLAEQAKQEQIAVLMKMQGAQARMAGLGAGSSLRLDLEVQDLLRPVITKTRKD